MRLAGADSGALPSEGAQQVGQREQQNVLLSQSRPAEEDTEGTFIPVRSRRTRRKQRQQLQQSNEGPYPSSAAEATSLNSAEADMDAAAVLLQALPEAESGCVVERVAEASFPNDTTAPCPTTVPSASLSGAGCATSCSNGDSIGACGPGDYFEEVKSVATTEKTSANMRGQAAGSARGKSNVRGEKKPVFYELRRLYVPAHRMTPLRKQWVMLIEPLVTHLQLQVRMNVRRRCVELRRNPSHDVVRPSNSPAFLEENSSLLQKGSDYVRAFLLGFAIRDALALLRLDDLSIESFEVRDVKRLGGDHLSRCLARLSGREGKTKFAIENATRTRLVFAGSTIHILGSFDNIRLARHACCSLILGAPPGKVYNHLRTVTRRLAERF